MMASDKPWNVFHDKPAGVVPHTVQSSSSLGAAGQVPAIASSAFASGASIRVLDAAGNLHGYTLVL
jgi:hypothetical protein